MSENEVEETEEVEYIPPDAFMLDIVLPEGYEHIAPLSHDFENCPTRVDRNGPYFIDDVLAALVCSQGNLTKAAILLRRSRARLKDYVYKTDAALELLDNLQEGVIDQVEQIHNYSAMAGNGSAARYLLGTKGRDRGYTTKTEVDHNHSPIEVVHKVKLVGPKEIVPEPELVGEGIVIDHDG